MKSGQHKWVLAAGIRVRARFYRSTAAGEWHLYRLPFAYLYADAGKWYDAVAIRILDGGIQVAPVNQVDAPITQRALAWDVEEERYLIELSESPVQHEAPSKLTLHIPRIDGMQGLMGQYDRRDI